MALLSNINDKFAVDSTGAIQFNGQAGTSGYVLKSNGNAAPTWVDPSTVIGGPYLPLSGGTLTGATATASGISFTVGGALTGTSATFAGYIAVQGGNKLLLNNPVNTASGSIVCPGGGSLALQSYGNDMIYLNENVEIKFFTSTVERMRIDSSGTVQVRNTTPTIQLYNTDNGLALNQTLGDIDWYQIDPSDQGVGTVARVRAINTSTFSGSADLTFQTGNATSITERLRITSLGKVGIGTTSPSEKLEVRAGTSSDAKISISKTDDTAGQSSVLMGHINNLGGVASLYNDAGTENIKFRSYGDSYINGGNVGIGTSSPNSKLNINGASAHLNFTGSNNRINFNGYRAIEGSHTGSLLQIGESYTSVALYGNVGIGTTTPNTALQVNQSTTVPLLVHRPSNTNFDPHGIGFSTRADALNGGLGDVRSGIFSDYNGDLFLAAATSSITTSPLTYSRLFIEGGNGNVGIGTGSPSAKLEVNGAVYVGPHSGNVNPTSGLFIENSSGNTAQFWMYSLGGSVFRIKEDAVKATIGYSSGLNKSVNFVNEGAGSINIGIGTTSPAQPLDVNGYAQVDKLIQRDNSTTVNLTTPRVLNIGYRGANGTYTFNPVTLFGSLAQGGQCTLEVTGWRAALNNGIIHWVDNGSNTNIGAGQVYYTQTAYKAGGQTGSNLISVSNASGTNNITITFTGWHTNSHGWNCKIISYQA